MILTWHFVFNVPKVKLVVGSIHLVTAVSFSMVCRRSFGKISFGSVAAPLGLATLQSCSTALQIRLTGPKMATSRGWVRCVELGGRHTNLMTNIKSIYILIILIPTTYRMLSSWHYRMMTGSRWVTRLSPIMAVGPSFLLAHGTTTFWNQSLETKRKSNRNSE